MGSLIDNGIFHINLFIIFTFFIGTSNAVLLSDLRIMCFMASTDSYKYIPKDTSCTAISWDSATNPKSEDFDKLNANLKRVYIKSDTDYSHYEDHLSSNNLNEFIDGLSKIIDDKRMDAIIFDNMYQVNDPGYNSERQSQILELFKNLKVKIPSTIFGIMLRWSPDPGFDLPFLEDVVPVFVYPAYSLGHCLYNADQSNMLTLDPANIVEQYVKGITSKLNSGKIILGIEIGVVSYLNDGGPIILDTHTYVCSKPPISSDLRTCNGSLLNYYQKGELVSKYNLAGSFLWCYDYDDFDCKCGCGCFAATTAIAAGVQGEPEPALTKCTSWTLLYGDRHNP